jgi:tRNA(His) 5'-end guanylyltransferase
MNKDTLGDRMKDYYENRTRISLPRRSYTIIRIDGKAFHSYTKGLNRPFDDGLIEDMDSTTAYLCKNIQGAKFGYVQSDEISILLCDFEDIGTQAWFDNNIQKMCSVSASMATSKFNQLRLMRTAKCGFDLLNDCKSQIFAIPLIHDMCNKKLAEFDSRVFQIPSSIEVENYFIWRQQDATRNSIQSVAQSLYSHKELNNKNCDQLQEMIFQKGINWNDYPSKYKRGRIISKETYTKDNTNRSRWTNINNNEIPIFTQEREFISNLIPKI